MRTPLLLAVLFVTGTALAYPPAVSLTIAKRISAGMVVANAAVLGQHIGKDPISKQPISVISLLESMEAADIPTPVVNAFARNILRQLEQKWWETRFQAGYRDGGGGQSAPPSRKRLPVYDESEYEIRKRIHESGEKKDKNKKNVKRNSKHIG